MRAHAMHIAVLAALARPVAVAVPNSAGETAATLFTGHDAIFDLYQSIEKNDDTPHIVFFTQRHCKNCYAMLRMFHAASKKARNETLNIIFGVIDCADIRDSCKLNLHIDDFPEVRYWDTEAGEHIRGIDRAQGRRYRQRRDYASFVHFARRFAHPFDDKRPLTAYPVVTDLAKSDFDKRIALEPEPCYVLKHIPDNHVMRDWFHAKAVQRHDRNGFFILKEGDHANTTAWPILHGLPPGLHLVSVRQGGVNSYTGKNPVLQGGHEVEQSLDEWIKTTPYPGVWRVHDDAEFEFLTRAPNKFFFAIFMLGENNEDEEATIAKFESISETSIFGKIGSFGILTESDWKVEAGAYGVHFGWFAPGDYHLVIMTQNGTYWYEDQDYLTLQALETEKSIENLLVGHYPQSHSLLNWLWWYSRKVWRCVAHWIEYAFLGPMEALICMAIAFACTSLCAAAIAAIDRMEQWLQKMENAKID